MTLADQSPLMHQGLFAVNNRTEVIDDRKKYFHAGIQRTFHLAQNEPIAAENIMRRKQIFLSYKNHPFVLILLTIPINPHTDLWNASWIPSPYRDVGASHASH